MKARLPLLALVVFTAMTSVNWSPEAAGIRLSDPETVKQHGTTLMAVTDQAMPRGRNVLWCATFQMAWDDAADHFGRPLRLQPDCALADSLNRQPFDRRWVDEDSVFAAQGQAGEQLFDKIGKGVRKKSGRPSKLLERIKQNSQAGDLVFFAMLDKKLSFPQPFGKLGAWQVGDRKVPWFGFAPDTKEHAALAKQARVHHYAAKNDFVVELQCKQSGDQLLLAKLPAAPKSVADVSKGVLDRLQANPPVAGHADLLAVPNVVANEETSYAELHGKTVVGTARFIRNTLQSIDFRMDEKGVELHSEAEITFGCSAAPPAVKPRLMILDPPFAIMMKRKDAPQPYFVAWIANADLLGGK